MRVFLAGIIGLALGCGTVPAPSRGTGAREAALGFFEAVIDSDAERAYAYLSDRSKAQSLPQFAARARSYCRHTDIEPKEVKVTSCDELDTQAVAHIVLVNGSKRYKDAALLHREATDWKITLPAHFGQKRK